MSSERKEDQKHHEISTAFNFITSLWYKLDKRMKTTTNIQRRGSYMEALRRVCLLMKGSWTLTSSPVPQVLEMWGYWKVLIACINNKCTLLLPTNHSALVYVSHAGNDN